LGILQEWTLSERHRLDVEILFTPRIDDIFQSA
jgi:hypothetical protein